MWMNIAVVMCVPHAIQFRQNSVTMFSIRQFPSHMVWWVSKKNFLFYFVSLEMHSPILQVICHYSQHDFEHQSVENQFESFSKTTLKIGCHKFDYFILFPTWVFVTLSEPFQLFLIYVTTFGFMYSFYFWRAAGRLSSSTELQGLRKDLFENSAQREYPHLVICVRECRQKLQIL